MDELAINGRFLSQQTTGVQRVARELTRAIDQLMRAGEHRGRVRLLCEAGADAGDLELAHIEVERVRGLRGHLWEQLALPAAQGRATLLCLGNTAPLASLLGGTGTAVLIHDLSYRLFPHAYHRRYRLLHGAILPAMLRSADPIVTVSESERALLARMAPAAVPRMVVAQNGSWRDGAALPPGADRPWRERRYLLYVGSFSPRKNFARIVEVAVRLAREDGLETRIVGSGGPVLRAPEYRNPAAVPEPDGMAGRGERLDELAELYAGARCLIFPSLYEASPLPPTEAMRFGCPVVASDLPSIRERCGDAVAYCDPASTDSVVAAVRRLLVDRALVATLVARCHQLSARYSWLAQARAVLAATRARRGGR